MGYLRAAVAFFAFCLYQAESAPPGNGHEYDLQDDIDETLRSESPVHHLSTEDEIAVPELSESEAFEGDIMGIDKAAFTDGDSKVNIQANAATDPEYKWPKGIVIFEISPQFRKEERQLIEEAMLNMQENTCIKFRRRRDEEDYLWLMAGVGACSSYVGRWKKMQRVLLSRGCIETGIILHELMHSLGFYHEHTRKDRDRYVEINFKNIKPSDHANFAVYNGETFKLPYDYGSVMHYKNNAFAITTKKWSIRPLPPNEHMLIGQRQSLSKLDVKKINNLYECEEASTKICGYLWTKPNFEGMMTVIYEGKRSSFYKKHKRQYGSAEILPGCEVTYHTEEAQDGVVLDPTNYDTLRPELQVQAERLVCECA